MFTDRLGLFMTGWLPVKQQANVCDSTWACGTGGEIQGRMADADGAG